MLESILIYSSTILITVFFAWIYQKKANTIFGKIICFLFIIIVPVLVSGFRDNVGIDFKSYKSYYNILAKLYENGNVFGTNIEIGYVLLNVLAKIIFNNPQGIFILSSLVFVSFSIGGIIKFKDKISMPIATLIFMTFFYSASFNAIRQLLAVSIIFYALSYAMERKLFKYMLFVFLAFLFHETALIGVLFYFLDPKSEKNIKKQELVFNVCVIFFIIALPILKNFIQFICNYFNFYSNYFDSNVGVKNVNFLLYIVPPLVLVFMYKRNLLKNDYRNLFLIRLMILQIPFQYLGYFVRFVDRLSLYTSISQIVLMPILIKCTNKENSKILKFLIVSWFIFYYFVVYILLNGNNVYPYNYVIGL